MSVHLPGLDVGALQRLLASLAQPRPAQRHIQASIGREVQLIPIGGGRRVYGFNGAVMGDL